MTRTPRKPFRNLDDSRAYLAKCALVCVMVEELFFHGCAKLPKFRRPREIARHRRQLRRSLRREVSHIKARGPFEGAPHVT